MTFVPLDREGRTVARAAASRRRRRWSGRASARGSCGASSVGACRRRRPRRSATPSSLLDDDGGGARAAAPPARVDGAAAALPAHAVGAHRSAGAAHAQPLVHPQDRAGAPERAQLPRHALWRHADALERGLGQPLGARLRRRCGDALHRAARADLPAPRRARSLRAPALGGGAHRGLVADEPGQRAVRESDQGAATSRTCAPSSPTCRSTPRSAVAPLECQSQEERALVDEVEKRMALQRRLVEQERAA